MWFMFIMREKKTTTFTFYDAWRPILTIAGNERQIEVKEKK